MATTRPHGTPAIEFSRLAAEFYENTPEAQKLKSRVGISKRLREAKMRAQLTEIFSDPNLSGPEKLEAKRKIESQTRIADKTDQSAAAWQAYREGYQATAKRDLKQAFNERPDQAFVHQEINYSPGVKYTGDLAPAASELVENARRVARTDGRTLSSEQEIAALKARKPGRGQGTLPAQLVPQGLADAYSGEQAGRLQAFDDKAVDEAQADFKSRADFARSRSRVKADQARARGQGAPRIDTNQFRFNSGGTIQRGGDAFDVEPGMGYRPASPYGVEPEEFVTSTVKSVPRPQVPAYPTMKPTGNRRPAATVLDEPL